jgi:hypothetical protein
MAAMRDIVDDLRECLSGHTCYEGCGDLLCLAWREIERLRGGTNKKAVYQVIDENGSWWMLAESFEEASARWKRNVIVNFDADASDAPTSIIRLCNPDEVIP